jgi:hypothetical protein
MIGFVAAAGLLLAGCGGDIWQTLGLAKKPPDEFVVVTRAPLSLPPDFTLRPPQPGAPRPQEPTVQERAKSTLYGNTTRTALSGRSKGEQALLDGAGASRASPEIRRTVEAEQATYAAADETLLEKMMFWNESDASAEIVDPTKEAERIKQASAVGEGPGEGETAVIERRKKTIFDILF